jgi:hypothetical protein
MTNSKPSDENAPVPPSTSPAWTGRGTVTPTVTSGMWGPQETPASSQRDS